MGPVVAQEPADELKERDRQIRALTESLAIARTEAELFRKKWAEAQLRAQTLGVDFRDADATQAQRQLIESLRTLYLAQAENQRLAEQLERLIAVTDRGGDVAGEAARAKELLAGRAQTALADAAAPDGRPENARVLDVNPQLRLVVLNMGTRQGARVGMPVAVLRDGRVIGQVRVVEVRDRICGALMENVEKNVTLAAGDTARVPGDEKSF